MPITFHHKAAYFSFTSCIPTRVLNYYALMSCTACIHLLWYRWFEFATQLHIVVAVQYTIVLVGRHTMHACTIITPRACTRGKAIGLSIVVVSTKIARSRVLGFCACYKHSQSVDIGEKLVCMGFTFLKKAS